MLVFGLAWIPPGSLGAAGARPVAVKWDVYSTQVKRVKSIFHECIM